MAKGLRIPADAAVAFWAMIQKIQYATGAAQLALLIDMLNAMSTAGRYRTPYHPKITPTP
jgi:hypothetical protein